MPTANEKIIELLKQRRKPEPKMVKLQKREPLDGDVICDERPVKLFGFTLFYLPTKRPSPARVMREMLK